MLRRPLHSKFVAAILDGRKSTTIRAKPWPLGVPIMLYQWTGAPYRSPQENVAVVEVVEAVPITIAQGRGGQMRHERQDFGPFSSLPLHELEGFDCREAMDAWFRRLVRPGQQICQVLHRLRRVNVTVEQPPDSGTPTHPHRSNDHGRCVPTAGSAIDGTVRGRPVKLLRRKPGVWAQIQFLDTGGLSVCEWWELKPDIPSAGTAD